MRTWSRSPHVLLLLGVLIGVPILAGCSAGSGSGTGAGASASTQAAASSTRPRYGDPYEGLDPNVPACKLLTQQEVADALTQTLKTPVGTDSPRKECHYVNAAGFGLTVELIPTTNAIADLAKRKADHGARASDLPGVGDAAYEVTGQRIIEFAKGNMIVNLYSESRTDILTPDEYHNLAKLAAGRLVQ
jgi:hypothetical protein